MQNTPLEALAAPHPPIPGTQQPQRSPQPRCLLGAMVAQGGEGSSGHISQHLPDLFLYSISNPVMMLLPSKRCVHRKFMLRAFTSRISSSGGSGGSGEDTGRGVMMGREAPPGAGGPSQQGFALWGNEYLGR